MGLASFLAQILSCSLLDKDVSGWEDLQMGYQGIMGSGRYMYTTCVLHHRQIGLANIKVGVDKESTGKQQNLATVVYYTQ